MNLINIYIDLDISKLVNGLPSANYCLLIIFQTLHICEEGLKKMQEQTNREEKPIWTWCLIVDLDGLSMRHLWRPGVKALLRIIETVEQNYPETMGRVLIVRAPRVFPILWTIVSAFIRKSNQILNSIYSRSLMLLFS